MSRKTSLGGDAVKLTASKIITSAISLLSAMLLSRFRSLEEYGTYSQLLMVVSLCTSIFMLGLPNSVSYFLARAETAEERKRFLSVYYTFSTLLSIVMGAVLCLAAPLICAYFNNPGINSFIYFLAVYPWSNVISSSIENVLVVYHRTTFLFGYRVANSACLLGIILLVRAMGWSFSVYMELLLAVYSVFAVSVYCIAARLGGGLSVSADRSMIRSILVFSVPMGLASVVGTLDVEIDKLLIGRMMDTSQLAIYTNASKELPVSIISASLTAVLLPQLTRMLKHGDRRGAVALWGDATVLSYLFICFIAAGVITYSRDVMTVLYSEKYLPGLSVFCVYSLVLLLRCTYFGIILNAFGETKKILVCSLVSLGLNAMLNPIFYDFFGMIGPAAATFLSMLIVLLGQLKMTANCVELSFREIFPWGRLGKITLINLGFSLVFFALKEFLPLERYLGSIWESVLLGCVWAGLYFLLMRGTIRRAWGGLNSKGDDSDAANA